MRSSVDGVVAHITIDNPTKRNAMCFDMYEIVPALVADIKRAQPRVVVIAGEGGAVFGAGSDISEFPRLRSTLEGAAEYSRVENEAAEALLSIPCPVLAKIHGPCMGGGLNLALTADVRYASDDSTFCVPPAKLGIGYPGQCSERR